MFDAHDAGPVRNVAVHTMPEDLYDNSMIRRKYDDQTMKYEQCLLSL